MLKYIVHYLCRYGYKLNELCLEGPHHKILLFMGFIDFSDLYAIEPLIRSANIMNIHDLEFHLVLSFQKHFERNNTV